LIREALELLSRPLRRRRWNRRRAFIISYSNGEITDEHICPPPDIPCAWEDRDRQDVRQDVHRWVESIRTRFVKKRFLLIDPRTGRVVSHDVESDLVDLGDGAQARYADIENALGECRIDLRYNPLAWDEDVDFFGPREWVEKRYNKLARDRRVELFRKEMQKTVATGQVKFDPDNPDSCILLPCHKCSSMTCMNPEEHFGFSYRQFEDGSWQDEK